MSKTILEQALDHLLNKEDDKASALLHDYYVSIGRQVYEDIMTDDVDLIDDEEVEEVFDAVDEVEEDLIGEDEEVVEPAADEDELTVDLGADPAADVPSEAADVADAMMDVESALAKLKAEFEGMVAGTNAPAEEPAADMPAEEPMPESIEESAELSKVSGVDNGDKADEKHSPVAGKNDMGGKAVSFGAGAAAGTSTPKVADMGGTTKPAFSKVKG